MMVVAGELAVEIRQLQGMDEAHTCAAFMSRSGPWVTLRRSYKVYIIPGHSEILLRKSIGPLTEFGHGVAKIDSSLENL